MAGAKILDAVLAPDGFEFHFLKEGVGSGGPFARGEFIRGDRRLELHFRRALGLVYYHVGRCSASHGAYMRELGVLEKCRYPGFSDDRMQAFHDLAHDLPMAGDFLRGSGTVLWLAAQKGNAEWVATSLYHQAAWAGDVGKLDRMHRLFWERRYGEVVSLARDLQYPNRMTELERKMVAFAMKHQ